MIDDRDLVRRIGASLDAYAGTVVVPDEPFDPTRRMADVGEPAALRPKRGRRLPQVAAVLAVAGLLAGGFALIHRDDGHRVTTDRIVPAAPRAPGDALAPTWAPEGWERTDVGWRSPLAGMSSSTGTDDDQPPYMGWPESGSRAQLFGDPDDPDDPGDRSRNVLLESGGTVVAQDPTAGLTVRGHPAWESDPGSGEPWLQQRPELRRVTWHEDGLDLAATFSLADRAEALAFLDHLVPRSGDPSNGFDAPAGDDLVQLGDAERPSTPPTSVSLVHEHTAGSGGTFDLDVDTFSPTGGPTVDYLIAWFYGDRAADGTATVWDRGSSTLIEVAADGRTVRAAISRVTPNHTATGVREVDGLGPARPIAEQAVASVAPVDAATLENWWADDNAAQRALPLLARVPLAGVDIELHGDGGIEAVCTVDGDDFVCTSGPPDADGGMLANVELAGVDYLLAAKQGRAPVFIGQDRGTDDTRVVEAETGHDHGWYVALTVNDASPGVLMVDPDLDGDGRYGETP